MKRTGNYDSTTPRAFTDRQREIDLLLVREDTNAMFEAFHRRRKLHRIRILDRFLPTGSITYDGDGKHISRMTGILIVETVLTCGLAFPILFKAMKSINMRARIISDRLSSRLSRVLNDSDAKALALERNLGTTVIERLKEEEWKNFWKKY